MSSCTNCHGVGVRHTSATCPKNESYTPKEQSKQDIRVILDDLEKRIKSSHRESFLPDRLPAENGKVARLARESAKDMAEQALRNYMADEFVKLVGEDTPEPLEMHRERSRRNQWRHELRTKIEEWRRG